MAKILVVDDEPAVRTLIKRYGEHEGHQITDAADGMEAIFLCRIRDFDLVIMDIMMPEMDGLTACKEIRKEKDIPMLMLSARGAEYDKLRGFEMGIDDYVVKPFSPKELMARIKVIVGRHKKNAFHQQELVFEGLRIDSAGRNVFVDGIKTELTTKEYDLLLYLVKNKGIALSRNQILDGVWGYEFFGDDRTVDWQIKLLRNKLGHYRDYIVTLRGVGYKFEAKK